MSSDHLSSDSFVSGQDFLEAYRHSLDVVHQAVQPLMDRHRGFVAHAPLSCVFCGRSFPFWVDFWEAPEDARVTNAINGRPFLGAVFGICLCCGLDAPRLSDAAVLGALEDRVLDRITPGCENPVRLVERRGGRIQAVDPDTVH